MMTEMIANHIINAVGMTILHSLWQVTMVYVILHFVLKLLSRYSSEIKYVVSLLSMFLVTALSIATFLMYYQADPVTHPDYSGVIAHGPDIKAVAAFPADNPHESPTSLSAIRVILFPWLAYLYFAGLFLMGLRMVTGSFWLHRRAKSAVIPPGQDVLCAFRRLTIRSGVRKDVRLAESLRVRIPEVIGYLKPVIIVPAGFFAEMPFEQAEAILAHELAHIRRKDYLFNIIQSVIEILFFYHPAIYLISSRIRNERENCCDDMALACCPGKETYVKALARMAEFRLRPFYPAVAVSDGKGGIFQRIKRILNQDTMKTKITDKLFAGIIILAGFGLIVLTGAAALNTFGATKKDMGSSVSLNIPFHQGGDTVPVDSLLTVNEKQIIVSQEDEKGVNHKYEMEFRNNKLVSLKVDGESIAESHFPEYKGVIEKTLDSVKSASEKVNRAGDKIAEIDFSNIQSKAKKSLEDLHKLDTSVINGHIRMTIDMAEMQDQVKAAREALDKLDIDSLEMEIEKAISPGELEKIRAEMERAKQSMHQELLRMKEQNNDPDIQFPGGDSLTVIINQSFSNIDWDKITQAMMQLDTDSINLAFKLDNIKIQSIRESLQKMDWDSIVSAADPSRYFDSSGSVLKDFDIASIRKDIEQSVQSLDKLDTVKIRMDLIETGQKLEDARKNLENTLREMDKR